MMLASFIAVCLVGSALAQYGGAGHGAQQGYGQHGQNWQQGQGASMGAAQGAAGNGGAQAAQAAGGSAAAHQRQSGARAARVEASAANRDEAVAGMRRRQSVLLAADHEEGAGYEGSAISVGSAGGGESASVHGYCGGVPMTGSQYLCCGGQYYGNTWSELDCCGNSIYDTRFYGCNKNVMAPLYRPTNVQPSDFGSHQPQRLCGNYVWQMYKAPYELCCDGVHYPNPYGHYACCGARAFDNRYYSCGRDEVKQRWYVFRRSTFVLAATEEVEAVGGRSQSGVGRIVSEEGAVANSEAAAHQQDAAQAAGAHGAGQGAAAGAAAHGGGHAAGAVGSAAGGAAGNGYRSAYQQPYFGLWGRGIGPAGAGGMNPAAGYYGK